ncbi:hypothetical protein U1Q18_015233 [Sarracenia purpurea var. burkii]
MSSEHGGASAPWMKVYAVTGGDGGAPLTAHWSRFGDLGRRSRRGDIDGALDLGRWEVDIAEDDAGRCCTGLDEGE